MTPLLDTNETKPKPLQTFQWIIHWKSLLVGMVFEKFCACSRFRQNKMQNKHTPKRSYDSLDFEHGEGEWKKVHGKKTIADQSRKVAGSLDFFRAVHLLLLLLHWLQPSHYRYGLGKAERSRSVLSSLPNCHQVQWTMGEDSDYDADHHHYVLHFEVLSSSSLFCFFPVWTWSQW